SKDNLLPCCGRCCRGSRQMRAERVRLRSASLAVIMMAATDLQEDAMPGVIPDKYTDLFNKKAFANLATLNSDGSPQVTPVWVDYDGKHVIVNSAEGRVKDRNLKRDR